MIKQTEKQQDWVTGRKKGGRGGSMYKNGDLHRLIRRKQNEEQRGKQGKEPRDLSPSDDVRCSRRT